MRVHNRPSFISLAVKRYIDTAVKCIHNHDPHACSAVLWLTTTCGEFYCQDTHVYARTYTQTQCAGTSIVSRPPHEEINHSLFRQTQSEHRKNRTAIIYGCIVFAYVGVLCARCDTGVRTWARARCADAGVVPVALRASTT